MKKTEFVKSCSNSLKKKKRRLSNHIGAYKELLNTMLITKTGKTYEQLRESFSRAEGVGEILCRHFQMDVIAGK